MRITERSRPWWVLAGTCFGLFLLMMDSTVVSLALPEIEKELGATAASLQWVMNGYLLVIAVSVVTAGRLGDIVGRRRVFLAGMTIFAAGSLLAALADDDRVLIAARAIQGLGGAAMLSLSLAIVSNAFDDATRPKALGIWAAVSSVALAVGPLLGGVLIEADWRLIFWLNVPICALGAAITLAATPESRDETAAPSIDVPGLLALTAGLGAVVLALIESDVWGFDDPRTIGLLAGGLAGLGAFVLIERRVANPIVEFDLFRNAPYLGATAAAFCLVGAYWGVIFYQPQFLQNVIGESPIVAGALVLPITLPMVFISPLSGSLIKRFGARALMTVGMACGTAGTLLLTRIDASSDFGDLLPGFALFGIALGLVYAPMSTAAMTAMPREKAGIASGVLAMNRVLAGAVILAAVGALVQALLSDGLESGESKPEAFASAVAGSNWVLAGVCAVGAVMTWWLLGKDPKPPRDPEPVEHEHQLHHRRFHL